MTYKVLFIARAGAYQGAALTSQVIEFDSIDQAETAVKALGSVHKEIAEHLSANINVVRLYAQGG